MTATEMVTPQPDALRKTVLITGTSDPASLGAALALSFLASGYKVIATCRPPLDRLQWLVEKGCEAVELDLTDPKSVDVTAARVIEITGGVLDVLINNASPNPRAPLLTFPMEDYRSGYEAIIFGPLRLIQLLSPALVNTAARPGRKRTVISNVGTAPRHTPIPWTGAYFPAKAAFEVISETLRHEMQPLNVAVFYLNLATLKTSAYTKEVHPMDLDSPSAPYYAGFHSTTLKEAQGILHPMVKGGSSPEDAAHWILSQCESSKGGGVVWYGKMIWLFRYIMPFLPNWLFDRLTLSLSPVSHVHPPKTAKID